MPGVGAKDTFLGEQSCRGRGKEGKNGFFREYQYLGGERRRGSSEGDQSLVSEGKMAQEKGKSEAKSGESQESTSGPR